MGTTMQETPQTNGQRKLRYIELFAGIGGFGLALNRLGHGCVYANEWDKYAAQIYNKNFSNKYKVQAESANVGYMPMPASKHVEGRAENYEIDTRDITTVRTEEIPDHDLLVGGFPCQAFSVAGKRRGFDDTRGTLFFDIARILKDKQPKFFILENVKGLLSHNNGSTFKTIISTLTELGYDLQWQVLNSKNFGVPQNRERVFIVGHLRGTSRPEVFPITEVSGLYPQEVTKQVSDAQIIYSTKGIAKTLKGLGGGLGAKTGLYAVPLKYLDRNQRNYQGDYSFTVDSMNTGGILKDTRVRRLTPIECERLQGFPDNWTKGISDTQRYKCLGNAVTVNVVYEIARRLE